MRAAWRLAISSLSQRPSRSVLLLLVVALSAALVCGVATAMASVTESLRSRMVGAVGTADLKIVTPASAKPSMTNCSPRSGVGRKCAPPRAGFGPRRRCGRSGRCGSRKMR